MCNNSNIFKFPKGIIPFLPLSSSYAFAQEGVTYVTPGENLINFRRMNFFFQCSSLNLMVEALWKSGQESMLGQRRGERKL